MGDRYHVPVCCPECGHEETAYYAPTCGFKIHTCTECGCKIDLEKLTGITEEEASNAGVMSDLASGIAERFSEQGCE